jgi:hypothetical protein
MTVYVMIVYGLVLNLLGSLARVIGLQQYLNAVFVLTALLFLLFGGVQAALPAYGRRTLFFSVTVPEDFRETNDARSLLRRYRRLVLLWTVMAAALALINIARLIPGSIWAAAAILGVGTVWSYSRVRSQTRPFAVASPPEREAPLATPTDDVRRTYLAIAVSSVPMVAAALFLWLHWSRFPDPTTLENGLAANGSVWAGLAMVAVAILHGSRRGGALRKINLTATIAFLWVCSVAPAAFTALRWFHPTEHFSGWLFSLVTILVVVAITVWRLRRSLQLRGSRDTTPDECWKLGRFYYNRQDPAFLTERRVGLGYTFNFARKITWILTAVLFLLPVLIFMPMMVAARGGVRANLQRKAIPVDSKVFDRYSGRYQMARQFILNITREGDHLYAQATGQRRFEIFPETENQYFARVANISISFHAGADGKAAEVIVHQGGMNVLAKRLAGNSEKPKGR